MIIPLPKNPVNTVIGIGFTVVDMAILIREGEEKGKTIDVVLFVRGTGALSPIEIIIIDPTVITPTM